MKKVFTLVAVAGILSFVACGPSAEEKAAIEKAKADSMALVESEAKMKATADSLAAAEEAKVIAEKAKADSIAAAEEAAKLKTMKKK